MRTGPGNPRGHFTKTRKSNDRFTSPDQSQGQDFNIPSTRAYTFWEPSVRHHRNITSEKGRELDGSEQRRDDSVEIGTKDDTQAGLYELLADPNISLRAQNALLRHGMTTIEELTSRTRQELLTEIIGLGIGSLNRIEEALARKNLSLAPDGAHSAHARPYSRPKDRHVRNHNKWQNNEPKP